MIQIRRIPISYYECVRERRYLKDRGIYGSGEYVEKKKEEHKMASEFKNPITIKEAVDKIHSRYYLLPAIQRKFTWTSEQIENLFDSVLRGYPINSFMFWKITDEGIKSGYKFYQFLLNYRQKYAEDNSDIDTAGVPDFEAVIDGQQRLTSLYIGLRGTYAKKQHRLWWRDDEECLPTRKLYLNLSKPVSQQYDNQKLYDFRFLTQEEIKTFNDAQDHDYWFEVKNIMSLSTLPDVTRYLKVNNLDENSFAYDTLVTFWNKIHNEKLINYYLQEEQDSDIVLDIFIRTNSGGTPLSFSDLLMSISTANWQKYDARKEIKDVIDQVRNNGGFDIDKDFVLKTCLVLMVDNIRFQLKNFTQENVQLFENNWPRIKKCIVSAFKLFKKLGFDDRSFRAKRAAIPVIYYIYYNNLEDQIFKPTYDKDNQESIAKWLTLSFIKSMFGGQPDSVLVKMRNVLKGHLNQAFPVQEIMDEFKNDPVRNYSIDDEYIKGMLRSEKGSNDAFYVLRILYPDLDYGAGIHQDHMHPKSQFENLEELKKIIPPADFDFAANPKNWNSVLNLQNLEESLNTSKQDKSLAAWAKERRIPNEKLYVNNNTSLEIKDFKAFICDRESVLLSAIKTLLM